MTDDINDVRHTSTLAKFEEAVRKDERSRCSPEIETPAGCVCQDQHRRGYCTEPGCPYSDPDIMKSRATKPATPIVARLRRAMESTTDEVARNDLREIVRDIETGHSSAGREDAATAPEHDDWSDERWNDGCDFAMGMVMCKPYSATSCAPSSARTGGPNDPAQGSVNPTPSAFDLAVMKERDQMRAGLEQIAIVCTKNMDRDCNHRMALDGVRQIANDALTSPNREAGK